MDYPYEPIEALAFRNFRKLKEVYIDFTQSPIVTVIGPNNVGKSAVSFGVRALGSNIHMKKHKNYIRSKQTEWEALMITKSAIAHRIKSKTGQRLSVYARQPDGTNKTVFSIDKIDGSIMPPEVDAVVGFCIEPETKELLNVRTYQNQLIFVDTPTSTNYKVVYGALKVESLSSASQIGNKEIGAKEKEKGELNVKINNNNEQLRKLRVVDIEPILKIRAELQKRLKVIETISTLRAMIDESNQLKEKAQLFTQVRELKPVSEELINCMNRLSSFTQELKQLNDREELNKQVSQLRAVDERPLTAFNSLFSALQEKNSINTENIKLTGQLKAVSDAHLRALGCFEELSGLTAQIQSYKAGTNKEVLSLQTYNVAILENLEKLQDALKDKKKTQTQYEENKKLAEELHEKLHSCGALVGTCPKCGELVVMEQ